MAERNRDRYGFDSRTRVDSIRCWLNCSVVAGTGLRQWGSSAERIGTAWLTCVLVLGWWALVLLFDNAYDIAHDEAFVCFERKN